MKNAFHYYHVLGILNNSSDGNFLSAGIELPLPCPFPFPLWYAIDWLLLPSFTQNLIVSKSVLKSLSLSLSPGLYSFDNLI